ncbi:MAG: amidohydrolase family protein [Bacteroidota bacterium]
MSRKISAHYVFPISSKPIKRGVVEVDDDGQILNIIDPGDEVKEMAGVEFYSGILVPGFVNTHCHIELSHLKGIVPEHTGLHNFISQISKIRIADEATILKGIKKADWEMQKNGIVAVGDISNTNHSIITKNNSKINYHTFVELFSLNPQKAKTVFDSGKKLKKELENKSLSSSIIPHTPYSVSKELFQLILDENKNETATISMHNQECASENELFIRKSGNIFDSLSNMGVDFSNFKPTGKNSLESVISYFPKKRKCLLVHNTFSDKRDINIANQHFNEVFWTFCPNANLYIENRLPDIPLFYKMNQKCTIGTDSLTSNHQLSVLEELKSIQAYYPQIPLTEILKWATFNGAEALNLSDKIGSFEIGKKPGINLISKIDFDKMQLRSESKVKVLV